MIFFHISEFSYKLIRFLLDRSVARHDLRCAIASCELRFAVASFDVRVRTHFVETCDVRACGAFLGLRCALHFGTFFSNNVRYEDWNTLSFGVYSNSVAQKLSLLAIFDPKNPFLTNLIDDRIKIKAEI